MEQGPGGRDATCAGLGQRMAAAAIDLLVIVAVWWVALTALVMLLAIAGRLDTRQLEGADPLALALTPQGMAIGLISGGVLYAVSGFYLVYAWTRLGATPGQQVLGVAVLQEAARVPLTAGQSTVRWFVLTLPPVGLVFGILMVVWLAVVVSTILRHPQRRGVQDLAAGSIVVQRRRRAGT
jgi:uncharacterized RDD family membrane protein YckC